MKQKEQFKRLITFLSSIVIIAIEAGLFMYVWYNTYSETILSPFWRRGNWAVIGMYALIITLLTKIYGGFKIGYLRMTDIILSQVLAIICSNIVAYIQVCIIGRDYMEISPLLKMTAIELVVVIVWVFIARQILQKLYPPRQMIIVYGNYSPEDLIEKINRRKDKYNICASIHISEGEERIKEVIAQYEAVVIHDVPAQIRNELMKYCFKKSIRTYMSPKISDLIIMGSDSIHLFDTPLMLSRNYGLSVEQLALKRVFDIVVSFIILIVTLPITLLIAILIKAYDRGPIFYKQERLTLDGAIFYIYKFRSMRVDSEKQGARLAMKNDSRVTPVGKVIRNLHVDELPQIFNILKGDMSLVGPRPERPEIAAEYEESIPEFNFRLKVKAGLTGYAQVYGKYNTTPYDKVKLDLTYIENYSFWLDLKLLMLTFKILFIKETTEGVDENQVTAQKSNVLDVSKDESCDAK